MDTTDLKKVLAGIAVTSLLAGSTLFLGGCYKAGKSGGGDSDKSAGSAPATPQNPELPPGQSG